MLTQSDFDRYDRENPGVYAAFMKFALEAFNSGRKHMGAKAIMERVRWQTMVDGKGDMFKINNNYTAFYVRKLLKDVPYMTGFFQRRTSIADLQVSA